MPFSKPGNLFVCRVRICTCEQLPSFLATYLFFRDSHPSVAAGLCLSGLMGGIAFREQLFFLPVSCAGRRNGFPDPLSA